MDRLKHCRNTPAVVAAIALLTVLALACYSGCGRPSGPHRFRVQGSATFAGKPIPVGDIIFEPDSTAGNKGPQGMATIRDGKYVTESSKGVIGGPHRIRITGYDGVSTDDSKPAKPLFPEFSATADFPKAASEKDFDVPANWKGDAGRGR